MTAKHYASADSIANAGASQVSRALPPKDRPGAPVPPLIQWPHSYPA
jgi:hypothetical protein